jgi:hypothetical protein
LRFAQISDPSVAKAPGGSGCELALQADLAKKATVSLRTIAAFERGEITPLPNDFSGDPSLDPVARLHADHRGRHDDAAMPTTGQQ